MQKTKPKDYETA